MTYAIGDIHGCKVALELLIGSLPKREGDVLVCVGDYVDRGADSKGVVDYLLLLRKELQLIHLIGNHELLLKWGMRSQEGMDLFLSDIVGGRETVKSYGGTLKSVPKEHWDFLLHESLPYYETDTHIFVHGGVDGEKEMAAQSVETLAWKRIHESGGHNSGKTVVCGHTIIGDVPVWIGDHTVGIDTGAGKGGWITALEVETGVYYQANEEGESRQGVLRKEGM